MLKAAEAQAKGQPNAQPANGDTGPKRLAFILGGRVNLERAHGMLTRLRSLKSARFDDWVGQTKSNPEALDELEAMGPETRRGAFGGYDPCIGWFIPNRRSDDRAMVRNARMRATDKRDLEAFLETAGAQVRPSKPASKALGRPSEPHARTVKVMGYVRDERKKSPDSKLAVIFKRVAVKAGLSAKRVEEIYRKHPKLRQEP